LALEVVVEQEERIAMDQKEAIAYFQQLLQKVVDSVPDIQASVVPVVQEVGQGGKAQGRQEAQAPLIRVTEVAAQM